MRLKLNFHLIFVFLCALMLTIMPLPNVFVSFRPPWVLLVLLYTQFYLPNYFSLIVTVILGISMDVLLSTILGQHVLALIIPAWIASGRTRRFHIFSMSQQLLLLTLLCFIYQLVLYLIDSYQGFNHTLLMMLATTLTSLMVWPWVNLLLSRFFNPGVQNREKFI